ncbi:PelD GGDEF domain-containing protein [Zoogloea sp.]|uniref:PelD GGDEF domain-containing protein n=1 Tax=Zoogloea sp. TaxID=49181 RepID=UPI00262487A8|nr:PelD GGDEF domain-containing protein [Zoogloea sp.]MDD3353221.1 PelD GGDEF domain-containing protein [Zoogloea sp.]
MKIKSLLTPVGPIGPAAVAEILLVPLLGVALCLWVNPNDPFFTRGPFPWVALGPVVVALRYGAVAGIGSALVVLAGWFGLARAELVDPRIPQDEFLGNLVLIMICGEFSSLWGNRVRRAEVLQHYVAGRLDHLTHQHYLLRLSHDRLEQDLISRPVSMRDALLNLRRATSLPPVRAGALPAGDELLRLLSQYCQIETAALVCIQEGQLAPEPDHILGHSVELDRTDPLILYALEREALSHVALEEVEQRGRTRYLVAVPLKDAAQRLHGMLVIERMPFFALHEESLQMLNLLVGYYADSLNLTRIAEPVLQAVPSCPPAFAGELMRLWHIRQDSGVRSALVALEFRRLSGFEDLPQQIARLQRGLDAVWACEGEQDRLLITLMPLAGESATEGYLSRIEAWLQQSRGVTLAEAGVASRVLLLEEDAPETLLRHLLGQCHVPV